MNILLTFCIYLPVTVSDRLFMYIPRPIFEPPQSKFNVVWDVIYPVSTGKLLPTFPKSVEYSPSM